jgi:hypothetical protein
MKTYQMMNRWRIFSLLAFVLMLPACTTTTGKGLDIKGSAFYGYDDNVQYSDTDEMHDLITRLTLGLDYLLEQKRQSLDVSAQLHEDLYSDHDELNNFSQDISGYFQKEISKYERYSIDEKFEHAEEPTSFEEEFGRVSGRFNTYKNKLLFEYRKDLSPHHLWITDIGNEIKNVDRPDLHDAIFNRFGQELDYLLSAKTSLFIKYDLIHSYIDTPDNAFIHTIAPGFKYFLTRQLVFETYGGANVINTFDGKTLVRPTFYAALTDELDRRSNFTLAFQKGHIPTGYTSDIFDQWRISLRYRRQLLERLNGYINAFYGDGEFVNSDITEKLSGVNWSLAYALTKNVEASVTFSHADKTSNVPTREYKKNSVFLGLVFRF